MTRQIKWIDRPDKGTACPDCKQVEVCAKCKSDIADAVYAINSAWNYRPAAMADLFPAHTMKGKNWYGEDGLL